MTIATIEITFQQDLILRTEDTMIREHIPQSKVDIRLIKEYILVIITTRQFTNSSICQN